MFENLGLKTLENLEICIFLKIVMRAQKGVRRLTQRKKWAKDLNPNIWQQWLYKKKNFCCTPDIYASLSRFLFSLLFSQF